MAAIPGSVPVAGFIAPTDDEDTYPAIDPIWGIDGYRSVADATERNAIPDGRRRWGMEVYTQGDAKLWRLNEGPWAGDDTDWTEVTGGGGSGITIDSTAITGGTAGRVLLHGVGDVVTESAALDFDEVTGHAGIGPGGTAFSDVILDVEEALATNNALTGVYSRIVYNPQGSGSGVVGLQSDIYSEEGTFNDIRGVLSGITFSGSGSCNSVSAFEVVAFDPGGAAITDLYGLKINDQAGATNSWAIKTGTGLNEFGDVLKTKDKIYPGTDAAALQTAAGIYAGTGAPSNSNGSDGDFYFRSDGGLLSTIYQRRSGTWTGIV